MARQLFVGRHTLRIVPGVCDELPWPTHGPHNTTLTVATLQISLER